MKQNKISQLIEVLETIQYIRNVITDQDIIDLKNFLKIGHERQKQKNPFNCPLSQNGFSLNLN